MHMPIAAKKIEIQKVEVPFIGSIDVQSNSFSGRAEIVLEWECADDDIKNYAADSRSYAPRFLPNLLCSNAIDSDISREINSSGSAFKIVWRPYGRRNHCCFHVDAVFIEDFELEHFPFGECAI